MATLLSTAPNYRGAGIHQYSQALLTFLPQQAPHFHYHAFLMDRGFAPAGLTPHYPARLSAKPWQRILWEQLQVARLARKLELALLHGFAYALPLAAPMPKVVTVHDLTFLRFPQAFPRTRRHYLARMTALSCRRARVVIADSKATAHDLQALLQVPAEKIVVVYPGVDPRYRPLPDRAVEAYRAKKQWPDRFILMVGTLEPRKNHLGLIEAYAIYRGLAQRPLPLVIGGGKGWHYRQIFQRVQALGLEQHVHFLGFVPWEDLPWLYNAATLFVYPSRYEGFGLPVAEAMRCGVPVITSNASSLPEVACHAAITIDPNEPEALARAMWTVTEKEPERLAAMREQGFHHAQQFQWERAAAQTARVYARALHDHA